jgi:hypothetical protein
MIAAFMSRIGQKPSQAKQRDAELLRVEAELKTARQQLEAIQDEIQRSYRLLAALQTPAALLFDGAPFVYTELGEKGRVASTPSHPE